MEVKGFYSLIAQKYISVRQRKSEIKRYLLCLAKISKKRFVDNIRKTGLNGYVSDFSVDCNIIDTSNIIDIHKSLMKKHDIK